MVDYERIIILVDEPITNWLNIQGRKFKISPFERDLIKKHIQELPIVE